MNSLFAELDFAVTGKARKYHSGLRLDPAFRSLCDLLLSKSREGLEYSLFDIVCAISRGTTGRRPSPQTMVEILSEIIK